MSRLIFAGTPETAVPSLRRLVAAGHDVAAVLTRPDAPVGRKRVLTPSPVAIVADELGIPTIKASRIDDETHAALAGVGADLAVVVAYGGLIPPRTLAAVDHGWINLHFSLLPRWRGAAPVQWSLIDGDATTGITVFVLEEGLDTGDIVAQIPQDIREDDTTGTLLQRLAETGADLLCSAAEDLLSGKVIPRPQVGEPTLAPKLRREDGRIDLTRPAARIKAQVAGVTPEPGAFADSEAAAEDPTADETATTASSVIKFGRMEAVPEVSDLAAGRLRVEPGKHGRVLVGTGSHALALTTVQPAGKKMMAATDWARGIDVDGTVLR